MMNDSADAVTQVPLLPGESVQMVFDSSDGFVSESAPRRDALVVTNERVVRDGVADGARVVSMFPLGALAAVEVSDNARSLERLGQGIVLAAVGLILGAVSWFVLEIQVLSVILGGLPILAGIYMLTGWAFPDRDGVLQLYAPGHAIVLPLRTNAARESVYAAMQRIYELRWGEQAAPRSAASTQSFAPPRPEVWEEAPVQEEEDEGAMEATLSKLVEEADAAPPAAPAPEEPRPSFWDIFRRKS